LIIISICLSGLSQLIPWGNLDVDTRIGPADARLDAEFYEHGVNYKINISGNVSIGGGIIGGGLGGEINQEISEEKMFLTGLGDFQENIGLIMDSYKDKTYTIKTSIQDPITNEFAETRIRVETHVDLIPWWPEGVAQKCSVKVTLVEPGNSKHVVVDKIKIILWRDFDITNQSYSISSESLTSNSPHRQLSGRNQSVKYDLEATISQNYGRVGIIGVVELSIVDKSDNSVPKNTIINLGEAKPMPAGRTNNIYTAENTKSLSIALMVAAFPMTILCIIILIISIPLVYIRHRKAFGVLLLATIIGLLAILFYINGIETLVDMLDSVMDASVRDGLSWSSMIALPAGAIGLLFVTVIMAFMIRPPKESKADRKTGSKSKRKSGKKSLPDFKVKSDTDVVDEDIAEVAIVQEVPTRLDYADESASEIVFKKKKKNRRK
jgi:hypothetical protein